MVDVLGDVLRPPHDTTPAAVKSDIKSEMRSFKSNENIHKKRRWVKSNGCTMLYQKDQLTEMKLGRSNI